MATISKHSTVSRLVAGTVLAVLTALFGFPLESDQSRRYGTAYRTTRSIRTAQRLDSADAVHHGGDESDPVVDLHGDQRDTPAGAASVKQRASAVTSFGSLARSWSLLARPTAESLHAGPSAHPSRGRAPPA